MKFQNIAPDVKLGKEVKIFNYVNLYGCEIGNNTKIGTFVEIQKGAKIGNNCIISKGVYVDFAVSIGNNVKIQNNVSVYHGVTIEDGVFIGPHVCFTNDKIPRAINLDGSLKRGDDWEVSKTMVKKGASIGANSTIVCGVTIGKWAFVGAGSVVTKDVPDYGLVYGNPAKLQDHVCKYGKKLDESKKCDVCGVDLK